MVVHCLSLVSCSSLFLPAAANSPFNCDSVCAAFLLIHHHTVLTSTNIQLFNPPHLTCSLQWFGKFIKKIYMYTELWYFFFFTANQMFYIYTLQRFMKLFIVNLKWTIVIHDDTRILPFPESLWCSSYRRNVTPTSTKAAFIIISAHICITHCISTHFHTPHWWNRLLIMLLHFWSDSDNSWKRFTALPHKILHCSLTVM